MLLIFAGHVNVAPRHLTAEAETLLSATLIHEVGLFFATQYTTIKFISLIN